MRKLIAFILVLCTLAITSCIQGNVPEEGNDALQHEELVPEKQEEQVEVKKESKAEIEALAAEALEKLRTVPEYPDTFPTLEDAKRLFERATVAVGWICNTESVPTIPGDTYEKNGLIYHRVRPDCHYGSHLLSEHGHELGETEKLIYNWETLTAYLETMIAPEEVYEFIYDAKEIKKFTQDKAGRLYVLPFSVAPEGFSDDVDFELNANDDGSYTLSVTYRILKADGSVKMERTENFKLIKLDNGRWVFKTFRVIWQ